MPMIPFGTGTGLEGGVTAVQVRRLLEPYNHNRTINIIILLPFTKPELIFTL